MNSACRQTETDIVLLRHTDRLMFKSLDNKTQLQHEKKFSYQKTLLGQLKNKLRIAHKQVKTITKS